MSGFVGPMAVIEVRVDTDNQVRALSGHDEA